MALASITYKAPNQHAATFIDPALDMFYLNSGTSIHTSNTEADFFALWPTTPRAVNGVGGSSILAVGISSIKLTIVKGLHLTLHDVLFIPSATVRLISVSALCAQTRCSLHFDDNTCWVTAHNGMRILNGALSACRLYSLTGGWLSVEHALLIHRLSTLHIWHGHLGHANYRAVYDLAHEERATGMPIDLSVSPGSCANCILGKQKRLSVLQIRQGTRASRKLGIIHVDLLEHPEHVSALGNKYVLNIVDDFFSYCWSIPLPAKSDAYKALMDWEHARKLETLLKATIYRSDNGELKCTALREWLLLCGTQYQFTAPHMSAHNRRVERVHRTLMGKARAMRSTCDMPPNHWDEFIVTACYLTNCTPVKSQKQPPPI